MRHKALLSAGLLLAIPARAQTPFELPTLTAEQRWARMEGHYVFLLAASAAHARSRGQSLEQYARHLGRLAAPSWARGLTPRGLIRGMYRNAMALREASFVVTDSSEAAPSARQNRPYVASFGSTGEVEGFTVDDFERFLFYVTDEIAKHHGLVYEQRRDGEFLVVTVRRR